MSMEFSHRPVLLDECIEGLAIKPDGCYLDGTAGGAGHSLEIAKRLTAGRLFSIDKDPDAVAAATERLRPYPVAEVIEGDFKDAPELLSGRCSGLDGALLDLGVSSHQLDDPERGFSHSAEGLLDMRMSQKGMSAAEIVNSWQWQAIADILRDYGEEPYAAAIAKRIERARQQQPIETTTQLSEIVASALPPAVRRKAKHPAKKTFMALRIAVNDELATLQKGLEGILSLLNPGGRFCVISFHSLEDRVVKRYFNSLFVGCTCPPDYPVCVCGGKPKAKAITKKPITASEQELELNRRSRSAKLRIIEKI